MHFHGLIIYFFLKSAGYTTVYFLIYLTRHVGCAQILALMNKVAVNIHTGFCVHISFHILGKYQGARLLDHKVRTDLILYDTVKLFTRVAVAFCIATSNE